MKAYLLAGGRGERLRPLTLETPKCLVPIDGRPLLGIWLDLFAREGITEVLLNVSHHEAKVRAYLASRNEGPSVTLVVEPEPIGSGRTGPATRKIQQAFQDVIRGRHPRSAATGFRPSRPRCV